MYQLLEKNLTNIIYFNKKFRTKIKNISDISLVLILKFYFMLLSFDSDMINKFKILLNPISANYFTKNYFNNQELIFLRGACNFNKDLLN